MAIINPNVVLQADTYLDEGTVNQAELSQALQVMPEILTTSVIQGSYTMGGTFAENNFPMIYLTKGMAGGSKGVKLQNFEYQYPIMGKIKRETVIVKNIYGSSDRCGLAGTNFKIYVKDKQFSKYQTIFLGDNTSQKYVLACQTEGKAVGTAYEYEVRLQRTSNADYIPYTMLAVGRLVSEGAKIIPVQGSDGVSNVGQLPGVATNMITYVRDGLNVEGNMSNKIMRYKIKVDGAVFNTYLDWRIFLADMRYNNTTEEWLWWSKYGKDSQGNFLNYDKETNKPVPTGSGIDEQITNSTTYSTLSYEKLARVIRDVTFDTGSTKAHIGIFTGTCGGEVFNDAMMDKLARLGFTLSSDKFVEGANSWEMTFGSFFKNFRHVDGHMVSVITHKMFDKGAWSRVVDPHPVSGKPLTSYDMYFIDMTTYDGLPNVQYLYEEGRQNIKFALNGMFNNFVGIDNSQVKVSAKDESSIQMAGSCGIQIYKTASCFKMYCTAS